MPDQSIWNSEIGGAPADEALFDAFADEFGVQLPETFKAQYRTCNGGQLQDVEWPEYLFPLSQSAAVYERICSLQKWAEAGAMVSADDLDWVEEEYGDAKLVFLLCSDGHTSYALNYNDCGPDGEPSIIYLDFECISDERVAPSFGAWIKQLTQSDTDAAVDWDEHQQYPALFRDTVSTDLTAHGRPEQIEQVLCREHNEGLLLFTQTQSDGRILERTRVSLPRGIDSAWLDIQPHRPGPVNTFVLHLQPVEMDDIHWITSRRAKDDTWKNERSDGVPIYCTVESHDRGMLDRLADELRQAGLVREAAPADYSDLPDDIREDMEQFEKMAEALMQQHQDMAHQPAPELPSEAPVPGGHPESMQDTAILGEVSQIILFYAGKLKHVRTPADAQRLIDEFAPHTQRYIDLMRQLNVAADPIKGMALRPAEQASQEAMNELSSRSPEAFQLLDRHGRAVLFEALRPKSLDASGDELVRKFGETSGAVAELLDRVMRDGAVEPYRDPLQTAVRQFADCEAEYRNAIQALEASEAGWIHQQRLASDEFASLQRAWSEFRTKHRKLYKENSELFQEMPDWF